MLYYVRIIINCGAHC